MSASLRRIVAVLLFLLLPFQAIAGTVAACKSAMSGCTQQMMQHKGCSDQTDKAPADGGCGGASSCAATPASPAALFDELALLLPKLQSVATACAPPRLHRSFIPDRLQRPPCYLA
jgi:hypothetical protein